MNSDPSNTTSDYPVTMTAPGSGFGTLLMLLQVFLHTKKVHQQAEQGLQMTPNITWSQNTFTEDGQSNLKESNSTDMENNHVSEIIRKKEIRESPTADEHILRKRDAGQHDKDTLEQIARLYAEIAKRYETITSLKKDLETCRSAAKQDGQSEIEALHEKIKKQETDIRDHMEQIARLETTNQEYQKEKFNLEIKNKQQFEEIQELRKELEKENSCSSIRNLQPLSVPNAGNSHIEVMLNNGFGPGSKIVISGKAGVSFPRMYFNLQSGENIPLHIDNRWSYGHRLILNSYQDHKWSEEVLITPEPINQGENFIVSILCFEKGFKICINDIIAHYTHRFPPSGINVLLIEYADMITSIYYRGYT